MKRSTNSVEVKRQNRNRVFRYVNRTGRDEYAGEFCCIRYQWTDGSYNCE